MIRKEERIQQLEKEIAEMYYKIARIVNGYFPFGNRNEIKEVVANLRIKDEKLKSELKKLQEA